MVRRFAFEELCVHCLESSLKYVYYQLSTIFRSSFLMFSSKNITIIKYCGLWYQTNITQSANCSIEGRNEKNSNSTYTIISLTDQRTKCVSKTHKNLQKHKSVSKTVQKLVQKICVPLKNITDGVYSIWTDLNI